MSFVSDPAKPAGHRLLAFALLLLLAGPLLCTTAHAQGVPIKIKITLKVVDGETGRPIPGANVFISRGEKIKNQSVRDIDGKADYFGEFNRDDLDFLVGPNHPHMLSVWADDYDKEEIQLSDHELDLASTRGDKSLNLGEIKLNKKAAGSTNANVQPANANAAALTGNSNRAAGNNNVTPPPGPSLFAGLGSLFGYVANILIWWLGLLTLIGLVGLGVALAFGYRPNTHRPAGAPDIPPGDMKLSSADTYLRLIERKVGEIDERLIRVDAAINKKKIKEPGSDKGGGGPEQSQEDEAIKRIFKEAFKELYGQATPTLTENKPPPQAPIPGTTQGGWVLRGGNEAAAKQSAAAQSHAPQTSQPPSARARLSYQNLLNDQPSSPEPLHLESEGTSSASGKLEDSSVYLMQVGHMQGTFVLFTEDGKAGYVYPNPALAFQGPALREVFPGLTEAEFNGAKQRIEPVPVTRVGDRRWKVGDHNSA